MRKLILNRKTLHVTEVVNAQTGEVHWELVQRYFGAGNRLVSESPACIFASNPLDPEPGERARHAELGARRKAG